MITPQEVDLLAIRACRSIQRLNAEVCDAESVRDGGALVQLLTLPGKLWSHCRDGGHLKSLSYLALCRGYWYPGMSLTLFILVAGMDLTGPRCLVSAHPHHVCLISVTDRAHPVISDHKPMTARHRERAESSNSCAGPLSEGATPSYLTGAVLLYDALAQVRYSGLSLGQAPEPKP